MNCTDGYRLTTDGMCRPCAKGCRMCVDEQSCTGCFGGYELNGNTQLCEAQGSFMGKYLDRNFNLVPCNPECNRDIKCRPDLCAGWSELSGVFAGVLSEDKGWAELYCLYVAMLDLPKRNLLHKLPSRCVKKLQVRTNLPRFLIFLGSRRNV